MNSKIIKWAAIGAGAWLLYRYFYPVKSLADSPVNPADLTGNPNAPVSEELNKVSGYKLNIPGGF
jgi:hypothetical protein